MKIFHALIGMLLNISSVFAAAETSDSSTAAILDPIRNVHIHFLNGDSDLLEAIQGKTEFAKKVYGVTDMDQYKVRARLFLSNGEVIDVSTDQEVYELKTPMGMDKADKIKVSGKVLCFNRQDYDHDGEFFTLPEKPFIIANLATDEATSVIGETAHLLLRLMGPKAVFGVGAIDPREWEKVIGEDRRSKLAAIAKQPERKLSTGLEVSGFLQVTIPYTEPSDMAQAGESSGTKAESQ